LLDFLVHPLEYSIQMIDNFCSIHLSFLRMIILKMYSCALAKGNSACGKKEAELCGTLVHTVAERRAAKSQ